MYEYPPMLKGSADSQLRQLRDYLVRLIQSMNEAEEAQKK